MKSNKTLPIAQPKTEHQPATARQITRHEIEELLLIESSLRNNENPRFYGDIGVSLLAKGLLVRREMSVRITPLGEETLLLVRNGGAID